MQLQQARRDLSCLQAAKKHSDTIGRGILARHTVQETRMRRRKLSNDAEGSNSQCLMTSAALAVAMERRFYQELLDVVGYRRIAAAAVTNPTPSTFPARLASTL